MTRIETCCQCDEPTGRAGRAEDSIYIEEIGPLCETCFEEISEESKC